MPPRKHKEYSISAIVTMDARNGFVLAHRFPGTAFVLGEGALTVKVTV
jgi:hypothetical protein